MAAEFVSEQSWFARFPVHPALSAVIVRPYPDDWYMGREAVEKAFADIRAALVVLNAEVDGWGAEPFSAADPLAGLADGNLDILSGALENQSAVREPPLARYRRPPAQRLRSMHSNRCSCGLLRMGLGGACCAASTLRTLTAAAVAYCGGT